jgi:hypothetical protein
MGHPGTGTDAPGRIGEGEGTPGGPSVSRTITTASEVSALTRPESAGSEDNSSGSAPPRGSAEDSGVDALVTQEEVLLGTSVRTDSGAGIGGGPDNRQGVDEAISDPVREKDGPGSVGTAGRADPVGESGNGRTAHDSKDGQPQGTSQSSTTPERAESPGADAQQEAVEAPGETGKQQPDLPEATPARQPEVPQSVQALIAEQVAAIKAEYDADLVEVKSELAKVTSELAQMRETLAAQSKAEATNRESAMRAEHPIEPDTTEQGVPGLRAEDDKSSEEHGNAAERRPWNSDARLDLYAAVGQTAPSVAAAIAQPDVINAAAAVGTLVATLVAGVIVRRSERRESRGH